MIAPMRRLLPSLWPEQDEHSLALRRPSRIEAVEVALTTDRYPDLSRMLAYWESKRGQRFAPRRADIDPAELVAFLPRLLLADVQRDPLEFRYRLVGTAICAMHGAEFTGKSPRDFEPAALGTVIHEHYCDVVRRREPTLYLLQLDTHVQSRSYARLLLPLSEDGREVTMLMALDSQEQNTGALREFFAEVTGRP
jgi:hypothetical protein